MLSQSLQQMELSRQGNYGGKKIGARNNTINFLDNQ